MSSRSRAASHRGRTAPLFQQLRFAEEKCQYGQPLLALRAERAQVAAAREDAHVVEVGPEARRPAFQVPRRACLQLADARRLRLVGELAAGEAELLGPLAEARLELRDGLPPPLDKLG